MVRFKPKSIQIGNFRQYICLNCGTPLSLSSQRRKYCSQACYLFVNRANAVGRARALSFKRHHGA